MKAYIKGISFISRTYDLVFEGSDLVRKKCKSDKGILDKLIGSSTIDIYDRLRYCGRSYECNEKFLTKYLRNSYHEIKDYGIDNFRRALHLAMYCGRAWE